MEPGCAVAHAAAHAALYAAVRPVSHERKIVMYGYQIANHASQIIHACRIAYPARQIIHAREIEDHAVQNVKHAQTI
eukprot:6180946-Pleurochrysis_carterae.AAC.1